MPQKWNLQDIRPPGSAPQTPREDPLRKPKLDISPRAPKVAAPEYLSDPDLASIDIIDGNSSKRKRVIVTTVIASIILVSSIFVNVLLGGAEITIYPKLRNVSIQANITTYTHPQAEELGYELLTLEASGEKQVKASGKETVSERATGKVFIYNTKSTSPQRLIKNTRFESKDGLIFRIQESIEVPGATKDAKGNITPGSVVADVFADSTGEQYNLPPARFTVPGLKGTEQYDLVYAESTAGFSGGFEGEKYIIDEAELSTAKQALHLELRDKLLARLKEEQPAGFVVYPAAITFAYDTLPSTEYGESLATIKENARLQVPMFREQEFAKYLAQKSIPEYKGDPVTLTDPSTLAFTYTNATTSSSDIATNESLDITLKGTTQIVWKFDEKKLLSELVGIKKTAATTVFSSYGSISNAQAEVRPFWKNSFPTNPNEITIKTILEEKK